MAAQPKLNSCLYDCRITHQRLAPKRHRFVNRLFMFYLDLDELPVLSTLLGLFGQAPWHWYRFKSSDHMPGSKAPLKQRVCDYLKTQGVDFSQTGRVMLLTHTRVLGYIFNPASFYFCFQPDGTPLCAIAEVGNTFREMKLFLVPRAKDIALENSSSTRSNQTHADFQTTSIKHFYVSPFSQLTLAFQFRLNLPANQFSVYINSVEPETGKPVLISMLEGEQRPLDNRQLVWTLLRYPLMTLQVITLIHLQAFLLYLKKIPFYSKQAFPEQQKNVLNPYQEKRKTHA